jgi:hypothetical protein
MRRHPHDSVRPPPLRFLLHGHLILLGTVSAIPSSPHRHKFVSLLELLHFS